MAACCWRSSRRGCWWQQWCFARCRCGAELHTDIAAANCELVGCQRRRRGALQLDLQPCSCTLRTPLRLHGSSTSQLSQLGATRPTAQVASYLMRRHRTARVGPSETCVQSAGSTVCGWGHAGRARTHYVTPTLPSTATGPGRARTSSRPSVHDCDRSDAVSLRTSTGTDHALHQPGTGRRYTRLPVTIPASRELARHRWTGRERVRGRSPSRRPWANSALPWLTLPAGQALGRVLRLP
jgi:hypothetical protein